jgi:hypothetical protein
MSGLLGKFTKQSGEALDYDVDFAPWFANRTDSYASHTTVAEPGITLVSTVRNGLSFKITLAGGVSGNKYKVTISVTTAAGLVKEADFQVAIKDV